MTHIHPFRLFVFSSFYYYAVHELSHSPNPTVTRQYPNLCGVIGNTKQRTYPTGTGLSLERIL